MDRIVFCLQVGIWDPTNSLHYTWNYSVAYAEVIQSLKNRTLKVTTILVNINLFFYFELDSTLIFKSKLLRKLLAILNIVY